MGRFAKPRAAPAWGELIDRLRAGCRRISINFSVQSSRKPERGEIQGLAPQLTLQTDIDTYHKDGMNDRLKLISGNGPFRRDPSAAPVEMAASTRRMILASGGDIKTLVARGTRDSVFRILRVSDCGGRMLLAMLHAES